MINTIIGKPMSIRPFLNKTYKIFLFSRHELVTLSATSEVIDVDLNVSIDGLGEKNIMDADNILPTLYNEESISEHADTYATHNITHTYFCAANQSNDRSQLNIDDHDQDAIFWPHGNKNDNLHHIQPSTSSSSLVSSSSPSHWSTRTFEEAPSTTSNPCQSRRTKFFKHSVRRNKLVHLKGVDTAAASSSAASSFERILIDDIFDYIVPPPPPPLSSSSTQTSTTFITHNNYSNISSTETIQAPSVLPPTTKRASKRKQTNNSPLSSRGSGASYTFENINSSTSTGTSHCVSGNSNVSVVVHDHCNISESTLPNNMSSNEQHISRTTSTLPPTMLSSATIMSAGGTMSGAAAALPFKFKVSQAVNNNPTNISNLPTISTPITTATTMDKHRIFFDKTHELQNTEITLDGFLIMHNICLDEISRNILHALHYESRFVVTDLVLHWLAYSGSSAYQRQVFASELKMLSIPFEDAWHTTNNTFAFVMNPHDFIFLVSTCVGRRHPELIYIIYHISHINYNYMMYKYRLLNHQMETTKKKLHDSNEALSNCNKEKIKLLQKIDQYAYKQTELHNQYYNVSQMAQKFKQKWAKSDKRVSQLLNDLYNNSNRYITSGLTTSTTSSATQSKPYSLPTNSLPSFTSVAGSVLCDLLSSKNPIKQPKIQPKSITSTTTTTTTTTSCMTTTTASIIKPIALHPSAVATTAEDIPEPKSSNTSLNNILTCSTNVNNYVKNLSIDDDNDHSSRRNRFLPRYIKMIVLFNIVPRINDDRKQRWWVVFRQRASFSQALKSLRKYYTFTEIYRWENIKSEKFNIFYTLQQECLNHSLKITKNLVENIGPSYISHQIIIDILQNIISQNEIKIEVFE